MYHKKANRRKHNYRMSENFLLSTLLFMLRCGTTLLYSKFNFASKLCKIFSSLPAYTILMLYTLRRMYAKSYSQTASTCQITTSMFLLELVTKMHEKLCVCVMSQAFHFIFSFCLSRKFFL